MKKRLAAIFLTLMIVSNAAQSALILFPVGFLIYLSPYCNYRPVTCLFFDESESTDSIKKELIERYAFLDESTVEALTAEVEKKLPESKNEEGFYEVSLERNVLLDKVLIPTGTYTQYPELSEQLIEDLR